MMKSLGEARNLGRFAAAFLIMSETLMPRQKTDPRLETHTIQVRLLLRTGMRILWGRD